MKKTNSPVVIVGGGLSGLVLAHFLSRDGQEVKIIEKRPDPSLTRYEDCRSINLTLSPRGMAVLRKVGLEEAIQEMAVPVHGRFVHKADGTEFEQKYGRSRSLLLWAIRRADLNKILVESVKKLPLVELLFECEFQSYDKKKNIITYKNLISEKLEEISPSFVVGADGAFSPFRQQLLKGEMANFKQEFFSWSYKQFDIGKELGENFDPHSIHVWPREKGLIIAIANTDGSFNCNLFLNKESDADFRAFQTEEQWSAFLSDQFPELAVKAIATELLKNPECGIVRNEVSSWHYKDQAALIGDSCHATYHFFAQGLNASLEDCETLSLSLRKNKNRLAAFKKYQEKRKPQTDAISSLSEKNFSTLKDSAATSRYHAKHLIESFLNKIFGRIWEPLYLMVAEGRIGYREAENRARAQVIIWKFSGMAAFQYLLAGLIHLHSLLSRKGRGEPTAVRYLPIPARAESIKMYAVLRSLLPFFLVLSSSSVAKTLSVGLASTLADVGSNSSIPHGDFFRKGVKLALEDQSSELKKKGIEIRFREFDYGNSRMQVLKIAKEAIASDAVAVIGYNFSDHALLAAPLHHQKGMAMITPTATADRIAEAGSYVHQMSFGNSFQAGLLAKLAIENLNAKRVAAVVAQDCTYCRDLEGDFKKAFVGSDREFTTLPVLKGDSDFEDAVKQYKAKNQKFDLIFIPNHELTSAKIILAFLKAGIKGPFLGGDGWANYAGRTFQSMFSDWTFNAYAISHWHEKWDNALSKKFLSEYEAKYHSIPNMTAAMAYDSMRYLIQGILSCDSHTRKAIEGCLSKIEDFDGVTGRYRFRKNQSPEKSLVLQEFKKNEFQFLKVVNP